MGTLTFNFTRDPNAAMPHFAYVVKRFPESPSAERALYFYCLNAIAAKNKPIAEGACRDFLSKYPRSTWAVHVTSLLNNDVAKLPAEERSHK